jgi:carboxypeptidase Q
LRRVLLRSELLKKGQRFQDFAYSHAGRNRVIGSPGLNLTINYVADTLKATGYYDVSFQEFKVPTASSDLSVNGAAVVNVPMTFTAEGNPSGTLVNVANFGCDAVSNSSFPTLSKVQNAEITKGGLPR